MDKGLLHLHSFLRWIILILLLFTFYKNFVDRNKAFTTTHQKTGLFLMIFCDIMLLIGLYQWFTGPWGLKSLQQHGMSAVMKDPVNRFFAVEHPMGMLIAIILVHIGYSYSKKSIPDAIKHKRAIFYFGLALLIILISVPWPFRAIGIGRAWFPGM